LSKEREWPRDGPVCSFLWFVFSGCICECKCSIGHDCGANICCVAIN
jgi:hypothetical protein